MASVHKLSMAQLQARIRERSRNAANVFVSVHCRQRMKQRHVGMALVLEVLRHGRLRRPAESDARFGSLVCRMEHDVAGRELAAVAALSDEHPGVVVVTVIDLKE